MMPFYPGLSNLVVPPFRVGLDSSGRLGFFLNNTEIFYLDKIALPDVRIGAPQTGTLYIDSAGPGAITLSSGFVDAWSLSLAGDVEHRNATVLPQWLSLVRNIATKGLGVAPIYGLDNRSGVSAADGSPIVLYAVPSGTGQLFRITSDIFATAFTSGTATYTITWTENAVTRTMVVTATVINTLGTATDLINPDGGTNITAQLTGAFTATVKVSATVEQLVAA